jgi:hypothetical protein
LAALAVLRCLIKEAAVGVPSDLRSVIETPRPRWKVFPLANIPLEGEDYCIITNLAFLIRENPLTDSVW